MSVDLSQFRCLCCGNCCRPHGVVRVDDREIQAMARLLELNESDFIELYCDLSPDRRGLTLVEHPDGSCISHRKIPAASNLLSPRSVKVFRANGPILRWKKSAPASWRSRPIKKNLNKINQF